MPALQAVVPVLSPTAQFGLNVFEGIRGYWNEVDRQLYLFRLREHLERLKHSCRLIGIVAPYSTDEITQAICDVLTANDYRTDIAVRVTVFVDGEGSWSTSEPTGMFVAPIERSRRSLSDMRGAKASVSSWERIDDRSLPPRIKAGANYINGRYAHMEAVANGYDFPILLDRFGKVSEGAGSCLMMVRNGVLVTPPVTASILESVTRDTLLELARVTGIKTETRTIDRTELYMSEEVFLCGSAAEIIPLVKVDRYDVGGGSIGVVTHKLLELYQRACDGREPDYRHWLTPVWQETRDR